MEVLRSLDLAKGITEGHICEGVREGKEERAGNAING